MNGLWTTFVVFTSLMSGAPDVPVLIGQAQIEHAEIPMDGHSVKVELRQIRAAIPFPSAATRLADITMVFDPQSGLFWWNYYQVPSSDQPPRRLAETLAKARFYIAKDKIVSFDFSRPNLWVRDCNERYSSMEQGQANVVAEIRNRAAEIEKGEWAWVHVINLGKDLGSDFLSLKGSASPFPEPKLREVKKEDGQWRLIFDGPNKDSAEVVLSDDYRVVSTKRFPPTGQ
jgi:hypothetical protein